MKKIFLFVFLGSSIIFFGYNLKSEQIYNSYSKSGNTEAVDSVPGWIQIPFGCPWTIKRVYFQNATTGCIVCNSYYNYDSIWSTTNGGTNWISRPFAVGGNPYVTTSNYEFNGTALFRTYNLAMPPYGYFTYLVGTTNYGQNWSQVSFLSYPTTNVYYSNFTICKNVGFMKITIASDETMNKSLNAGSGWTGPVNFVGSKINSPSYSDLNPNNIFAVETNIFRSSDMGSNFSMVKNGTVAYVRVCAVDSNIVIAVGGTVLSRSTNAGTNWTDVTYPFSLNSLTFPNASTGYFTGDNGKLYKTTNKGLNWAAQTISTTNNLVDCYFVNTLTGYAIGANNVVFKTTTGGITVPSAITTPSTTANKFELFQNYPNPFNPVTKINYSIPVKEFVILKIYDLLGREIKTLLSEIKTPGNYTVDFVADGLSSGVYFYKLQAGDFIQIRKMAIVK